MTDRVHIGPLTFEADGSNGFVYSKLSGWLSGAPFRAEVDDNPNADGASEVDRDYRAARVITFEGGLVGSSLQDAEQNFFDQFAALQADGAPILFSVEKDWGTRHCMVSIMDVAEVTEVGAGLVAEANVQLVARDPIKYGPASSLAIGLPVAGGGLAYNLGSGAAGVLDYGANGELGRTILSNAGTAAVWPSVLVTGELSAGFFVQRLDTGQVVRYDRVVPAGSTVAVDFRTGEVLVDGVSDGSTYLTRYEFWSVAPGSSCEVQFNSIGSSSGAPVATWTISDGYW